MIACRTYDLEHDTEISQWLSSQKQGNKNQLAEFKIDSLSEETVIKIARNLSVNKLSKR